MDFLPNYEALTLYCINSVCTWHKIKQHIIYAVSELQSTLMWVMSSKKSNWAVCWVEFVCAFPRRICIDFFIAERNLSRSPKPMRGTKPGQLHSGCMLCPSKISLNKANPCTQSKPSVWYSQFLTNNTCHKCVTSFQNKYHKIRHKDKINSNKNKK